MLPLEFTLYQKAVQVIYRTTSHSQITPQGKIGTESGRNRSWAINSCPISHQLPSWNYKPAAGGLLTIHGGFPPKSSTLRFYKQYKEGGRTLVSLWSTIKNETGNNCEYIRKIAPQGWITKRVPEAVEAELWKNKPLHAMMLPADREGGWHLEIIPVAGIGQPEGQYSSWLWSWQHKSSP